MEVQSERAASYFTRALAVIFGGVLVHLVVAFALLEVLAGARAVGPIDLALKLVVAVSVGVTAALALSLFYVRANRAGPVDVSRVVPMVLRLAPPVFVAAAIPAFFTREMVVAPRELLVYSVTVGAAAWAPALLVALLLQAVLHAIAIRIRPESLAVELRRIAHQGLAASFGQVLVHVATVAVMLAVAGLLVVSPDPVGLAGEPRAWAMFISSGVVVLLAYLAGASAAQSPAQDVQAIARRLDALGYNARQTMQWSVRVTSFNAVGVLFAELERLRARLSREVALYQDALDRTREADAMKAQFLAAVSHELRTPLNSIVGFAQLLLEGIAEPLTEAQAEDVRLIRAGGHQLLALINDILDISMIESGELSLTFAPHDLRVVIDEVVSIHQPLVRDKNVDLVLELSPRLPEVVCDRRRVGQVLTNLLSNAIKFTDEGSVTVRARVELAEGVVVLEVEDTGVGITEDDLAQIFEEYKQVGSLKKRKKGTGLGLAIARSIATHHGGGLSATSRPGEGSVFRLELPVEPERQPSSIDMTAAVVRARHRTGEVPVVPRSEAPVAEEASST